MAKIELRHATIRLKDGFSGTALVNDTPLNGDTNMDIDTVSANGPLGTNRVPVGARFTFNHVETQATSGAITLTATAQTVTITAVDAGNYEGSAGNLNVIFTVDGAIGPAATAVVATGTLTIKVKNGSTTLTQIKTAVEGIGPGDFAVSVSSGGAAFNVADSGTTGTMTGGTDETALPDTVYTVTARTPSNGSAATTNIVFTPALVTGSLAYNNDTLTLLPIRLTIKVGDGNLTYTEKRNMSYELDRGVLDTVKEGDDAPVELKLQFVYEFVTTGTSETTTPPDAVKRIGAAAEWTSSSSDLCEPYAVDVEVEYIPPCTSGGTQTETTVFPDFRYEQLDFDLKQASIAVSGKSNARQPTVTRS